MSTDPHDLARRIILDHAADVEWLSISEMTEPDADEAGLTIPQHESLCADIDTLIGQAKVTVTWDDETTGGEG